MLHQLARIVVCAAENQSVNVGVGAGIARDLVDEESVDGLEGGEVEISIFIQHDTGYGVMFAEVARQVDEANPTVSTGELPADLGRVVLAGIVDQHQFQVVAGRRLFAQAVGQLIEGASAVVDGYDHG